MKKPDEALLTKVISDWAGWCYAQSGNKGFWEDTDKLAGLIATGSVLPAKKRYLKVLQLLEDTQKFALMHAEISEALEAARKNLESSHIPGFTGIEEELADVIIRVFDYAGRRQLDLGRAIVAKMNFNAGRPFKHGKEF